MKRSPAAGADCRENGGPSVCIVPAHRRIPKQCLDSVLDQTRAC